MCFVSSTVLSSFAAVSDASPPAWSSFPDVDGEAAPAADAAEGVGAADLEAEVPLLAFFSGSFCLTMMLAVPSESFFMKFHASIRLIRVQSVLFTERISSPTLSTPVLSAAPPANTTYVFNTSAKNEFTIAMLTSEDFLDRKGPIS